ncbi:hypothetical protein C5S39_01895 [Candidatus Methanophagaceae archaeon]|nr:hypothetical protein C5S39_01895 [Methanophagales archaeon]
MPLIYFFVIKWEDEKERRRGGRGKKPRFKRSEMHGDMPSNFEKV